MITKRAGKIPAQAAAGAGDQRDLPGEVEEWCHRGCSMFAGAASILSILSILSIRGSSTIFIRLGSRAWSRSNQDGPSLSGAMAVISGLTLIFPPAISSIARGYSPAEAHDPCSRI